MSSVYTHIRSKKNRGRLQIFILLAYYKKIIKRGKILPLSILLPVLMNKEAYYWIKRIRGKLSDKTGNKMSDR